MATGNKNVISILFGGKSKMTFIPKDNKYELWVFGESPFFTGTKEEILNAIRRLKIDILNNLPSNNSY